MTTETADQEDKPSEWTRLPSAKQDKDNGKERVRAALEQGAGQVAKVIGRGVRKAGDVLTAPAPGDVEQLLGDTNLPELSGDDALVALAVRLDRESDFWRALALKTLSRAAWADRTAHFTAILGALGCAALAAVAGMEALFGGAAIKSLLVMAGAAALVAGSLSVAWVSAMIRRSQRELTREALGRADLTELRLHRVAVVLSIRREDPASLPEAIKRLEKETSAPVR